MFQKFKLIDALFLLDENCNFSELYLLIKNGIVSLEEASNYLNFLIKRDVDSAELTDLIELISLPKEEMLGALSKYNATRVFLKGKPLKVFYLIIKWFTQTEQLPKGLDGVEFLQDMLILFNHPEYEMKYLNLSFSELHHVPQSIKRYLEEAGNIFSSKAAKTGNRSKVSYRSSADIFDKG